MKFGCFYPIYASKKVVQTSVLLIGEKVKRQYVLIKDFNTLMHDRTLRCGRKHFSRYYLQAFSTGEILKCHIKDCFKVNGKRRIIIPKKGK